MEKTPKKSATIIVKVVPKMKRLLTLKSRAEGHDDLSKYLRAKFTLLINNG